MKLLRMMIKKRIWLFIITIIISLSSITVTMLWNYKLAELINFVSKGHGIGLEKLWNVLLLLLAMIILQALLTLMSGYTCENMNHDLRLWYAKRYIIKDLLLLETMSTGQQLSILQNEVNEVSSYISNNLFQLMNDLLRFAGTFAWLIFLNPRLALSANLPVIFIVIYVAWSSKIISKYATISQQENQSMNGILDTILTLFPIMKLYDAGELMNEKYYQVVTAWERAGIKEERARAGLMSLSALLTCLPLLLLLLIGGRQVIMGDLNIGILYIFINLSGNVSGVMMNMPGHIGTFRRFTANLERLKPEYNELGVDRYGY